MGAYGEASDVVHALLKLTAAKKADLLKLTAAAKKAETAFKEMGSLARRGTPIEADSEATLTLSLRRHRTGVQHSSASTRPPPNACTVSSTPPTMALSSLPSVGIHLYGASWWERSAYGVQY